MNMNFDLNEINAQAIENEQEQASVSEVVTDVQEEQEAVQDASEASEKTSTQLQTMTIDQSIYAVVEPGTAPLIRSSTTTESSKLFNALNGSAEPVKNYLEEEVDVIDIVITSADVPSIMGDEDSERVCKPCVHFFTLDGAHISSISNGIIKSTKMLLACGLTPTEDTPIRIRFKEIETRKGKAHTFEMV